MMIEEVCYEFESIMPIKQVDFGLFLKKLKYYVSIDGTLSLQAMKTIYSEL